MISLKSFWHWRWHRAIWSGGSGIGPLAFELAIGSLASGHCHQAIAISSRANNMNRLFDYHKSFNLALNHRSIQLLQLNGTSELNQVISWPWQWHWAIGTLASGALEFDY